jgi:hypothetical protein
MHVPSSACFITKIRLISDVRDITVSRVVSRFEEKMFECEN